MAPEKEKACKLLKLARLDDRRARPGGAVNGGALVRRSFRPLTAPAGIAFF